MLNNRLRTIGFAVAMTAVGVLPLESASATTASGLASLDMSGLTLSFSSGPGSPVEFIGSFTSINAAALGTSDFQTTFDPNAPLESSTHVSFPGLFDFDLVGSASPSSVSASFNLVSPLNGSAFNHTSSRATAGRAATITTLGAGTLTVSVPYTLSSATDEAGVFSDSRATMTLLRKRGIGSSFDETATVILSADFAADATLADSGLLTLVVPFLSGDKITLGFQADVSGFAELPEPVPLPPTALLLGGGMLGLLWRRRAA